MVVSVATHTMLQQTNRPLWACPGSRNLSRLTVLPKPQRQRKRTSGLSVSSSAIADPAALEVLSFDGEARGSERLALKIADPFTAKGLVHRCVVTEKQNARRVSRMIRMQPFDSAFLCMQVTCQGSRTLKPTVEGGEALQLFLESFSIQLRHGLS